MAAGTVDNNELKLLTSFYCFLTVVCVFVGGTFYMNAKGVE